MKFLKALAFAGLIAVSGTASQAAVLYATSVDSYTQGLGITDPNRLVQANALGAPDGAFLSLGRTGEAIVSFGKRFKAIGTLTEITFGNRDNHIEKVELYGGVNGVFTYLGTITNTVANSAFSFAGVFDQLKLVDVSPAGPRRDGWDIDAISVVPVPVPAGGLLLLTAIGAVSMLRRRKA
jgi:hypothetical protein